MILAKGFFMLVGVKVVKVGNRTVDLPMRQYENVGIVEAARLRVADDWALYCTDEPIQVIVKVGGVVYGDSVDHPLIVRRNVSYSVSGQRGGM